MPWDRQRLNSTPAYAVVSLEGDRCLLLMVAFSVPPARCPRRPSRDLLFHDDGCFRTVTTRTSGPGAADVLDVRRCLDLLQAHAPPPLPLSALFADDQSNRSPHQADPMPSAASPAVSRSRSKCRTRCRPASAGMFAPSTTQAAAPWSESWDWWVWLKKHVPVVVYRSPEAIPSCDIPPPSLELRLPLPQLWSHAVAVSTGSDRDRAPPRPKAFPETLLA